MVYNPKDHKLWSFTDTGKTIGWGHMAKDNNSWELAVSVEHEHQNKGIGSSLIKEMINWAKFHKVQEVYMHCIDDNKTIQHLATKHMLKTKERFAGERVSSIEVPDATLFEKNAQLFKEQTDIILQIGELRSRLTKLWINPSLK
jgi:GNAT superfamily N-acetyltransferase